MSLALPRKLHFEIHLGWQVCVHLRGGSWDKLTGAKGDKARWLPWRKAKTWKTAPLWGIETSQSQDSLSELTRVPFHMYFLFSKLSTLWFNFCLLAWIHSWLVRQGLGTLALTAVAQWLGLLVRKTKIVLPATAYCKQLLTTGCIWNHNEERPVFTNNKLHQREEKVQRGSESQSY